jgi:Flp pilus assembly pilin Flp
MRSAGAQPTSARASLRDTCRMGAEGIELASIALLIAVVVLALIFASV